MTDVLDETRVRVAGIGIDFGTSNSVIGILGTDGTVRFSQFADRGRLFTTLPTLLCLAPSDDPAHRGVRRATGFAAIEEYLADPSRSRLLQSLKSHLGARTFDQTQIGPESFDLPQLIAAFLEGFFQQAGIAPDALRVAVVCGRPVKFAGKDPDDSLAEARLRKAYELVSLQATAIRTEAEAAAYAYSRTSSGDQLALIADLGGGTSDFSVVRLTGEGSRRRIEPLSQVGIGVAGDTFDARIVEKVLAPMLGLSGRFRPQDKWLPMPNWIVWEVARRHRVASLRTPKILRQLRDIGSKCDQPEQFAGLVHIVAQGLGYQLFSAISALKAALSSTDEATLSFQDGPVHIETDVRRVDFEAWIGADMDAIEGAAEQAVRDASIETAQISAAFLTGGSSLVPSIQARFRSRFPSATFALNDRFSSVARGLALMSAEYR